MFFTQCQVHVLLLWCNNIFILWIILPLLVNIQLELRSSSTEKVDLFCVFHLQLICVENGQLCAGLIVAFFFFCSIDRYSGKFVLHKKLSSLLNT